MVIFHHARLHKLKKFDRFVASDVDQPFYWERRKGVFFAFASWWVENSEPSACQEWPKVITEWREALAKRSCTGIAREELQKRLICERSELGVFFSFRKVFHISSLNNYRITYILYNYR